MTRWNRSTRPLALLVIGSLATSAAAQPSSAPKKQPTQQELDLARAHFKAAEAAKQRGDYRTAAAQYLAAYELFEDPEFFFDIGEVYRLAGDEPKALTYYQQYLALEPNGRGAAAARTAIGQIDEAKRKADEEARGKADEDAAKRAADATVQANPPPAPASSAPGGRGLRIAGLATGGAGVAALGVGVIFGLRAKSISDEAAGWDRFDQARLDRGEAAERNMFLLTGVGTAALVTGGVLYSLGHRANTTDDDGARTAVTFAPAIVSGAVAFTAVGRF